jgi:hypothetical protein
MLMTARVHTEGCRALGQWVPRALDAEKHAGAPEVRARAHDSVAMMNSVLKAQFTDLGSEVANLTVQVYGGQGYIREQGVEQFVHNAPITQINEGTNGVQALVARKLPAQMGRTLRPSFHAVSRACEETPVGIDPQLAAFTAALRQAFGALQLMTATIARRTSCGRRPLTSGKAAANLDSEK